MPTRHVGLTDRQSQLVSTLVESGHYDSVEQVVDDALDLLIEHDAADDDVKLARLRAEVHLGIDAIARGDYQDFDSVDDLVHHIQQLGNEMISVIDV